MNSPRKRKARPKTALPKVKTAIAPPRPVATADVRAPLLICIGVALVAVCVWSYWPNLIEMVGIWRWEADYSHGFLVLPVALAFLWIRRDRFPKDSMQPAILAGLALVGMSIGIRLLAARYFIIPIDNWTMLIWISGTVLALFGWRILWWSLPSILFLWFAMPLPYRLSIGLRQPLQEVAAMISSTALLVLGQPAIADGSLIHIGDNDYGVDEACSGLRIFFGIAAFAFALAIITRRTWITKGLLLLSVLPVAIVANSARIVVTCLLFENVSSEAAAKFSHDIAGFVMIPVAGAMLCFVLWLLSTLFKEVEVVRSTAFFQERNSPEKSAAAGHG